MRCVLLLLVYQGRDIHGRIYLNEQGINAQVTQASAPQNIAHDSPNLCSKQMPSHPDCSIVVLGTTVTTSICPLGGGIDIELLYDIEIYSSLLTASSG